MSMPPWEITTAVLRRRTSEPFIPSWWFSAFRSDRILLSKCNMFLSRRRWAMPVLPDTQVSTKAHVANMPSSLLFRAILDLKTQRDKLHQYQRRITVLTDRETAIAKEMLAKGDKKRALLALRRKKYQESLLAKTDGQLEQLEKLTSSVEFALIQKDVIFGLQQGTKVLKDIHAEMGGIAHVEKLMGETADAIAYQKVSLSSASVAKKEHYRKLSTPPGALNVVPDLLFSLANPVGLR